MLTSTRYRDRSLAAEDTIRSAFEFENDTAPYMINDVNYWLFGDLPENIPADYCSEDPTSMIDFQVRKIERHLAEYDDIYIPFLMPWYGTGVLASGFGVDIVFQDRMDPAVDLSRITDVAELKDLRKPDPEKDGLMPRVLNAIAEMRRRTDLPVGVTDCQGPLTTALQILGYDKLIYWMYDYPEAIHDVMQLVTDALIEWVTVQKRAVGQEMTDDAYVLGIKIPGGYGGVWMSDDDSIIFGPELYREFVAPYNSQVLKAFGGGSIHYCGNANQHIENYLATEGLTCIQNLNLDDLDGAARMRDALAERKIPYLVADFNVADDRIDAYYRTLFEKMGTRGLIVTAYTAPAITLSEGQYATASRDPLTVGKVIEQAINKYNRPAGA
ncbi:MAG: uroporphyrinogen decarboxylase family protein [Phycisphaerae bacterium]|jgi:uroporphyrinogen-III decarboxylase|nr:uroporphyrinogen decarboxylase family protein [Phycisphaerae bacterium]